MDAEVTTKDLGTDDSDLKWLEVIRGDRQGVAKMPCSDMVLQGKILRKEIAKESEEKSKRKSDADKTVFVSPFMLGISLYCLLFLSFLFLL